MIIKSLAHYKNDIELVWLSGHYTDHSQRRHLSVRFRDLSNSNYFQETLPFAYLPFLMPGLVVSRGEVQIARVTGKSGQINLSDLSDAEEVDAGDAVPLSLYSFGHHLGGGQRILRYRSGDKVILIPSIEMIRFLFLHSRVLADALMVPSGLQTLAVTPDPGLAWEIEIRFEKDVPRRLLTVDFIREFAWLSVHPDGRKAWDSIGRRSLGQRFLTLDLPPIQNCSLEFRGVEKNGCWLVMEIIALSGREQPARSIVWRHPSVREPSRIGLSGNKNSLSHDQANGSRSAHEREHLVDGEAENQNNTNQDVILLGGKRGCFKSTSSVTKKLLPRQDPTNGSGPSLCRNARRDAGQLVNPDLPPMVIRKSVSAGPTAFSGGLQPVEFLTLDQAGVEHIGDLGLLEEVLWRIEQAMPDLTLTFRLVLLKPGRAISYVGLRRRACLVAVFSSLTRPLSVLLDVDHTGLSGGLSGLLLSYDAPTPMSDVARHISQMLNALVDCHGHWDIRSERRLPHHVSVKRLPKLVRMINRAKDDGYVQRWALRLTEMFIAKR